MNGVRMRVGWRGHLPHREASIDAGDQIPCFKCLEHMVPEPCTFTRKYILDDLREWKAQQNQRSIQGDEQDAQEEDAASDVSPERESNRVEERNGGRARTGLMTTCDLGHQVAVEDVIAKSVTFECVLCPECEQHRTWPPHCFSRNRCVGQVDQEGFSSAHTKALSCPKCEAANRPARVRLFDTLVPEIFVSYFVGEKDESTGKFNIQEWVEEKKSRVEQCAQVLCWFDAAAAVHSGQARVAVMEEGIRKSRAVLLFLTDGYLMSDDCIRVLLACFKNKKYLIPILMPDVAQELGWSGSGAGDDWWEHCRTVSSNVNPDTGKLLSWAPLAHFKPVDMRGDDAGAGVLEVVSRIQSCLLAGGFVEHECSLLHSLWNGKAIFCSFKEALGSNRLVQEARFFFEKCDADRDGHITPDELAHAFPQLTQEAVEQIVLHADHDADGRIDFEEWAHIVQLLAMETRTLRSRAPRGKEHDLAATANGGGAKLYPVGVCTQQLLAEYSYLDHEHAQLLIADADADDDGCLTFDELMAVIEAVAHGSPRVTAP